MSVKPEKNRPTMAEQADIHELYEESVQNVENEVEFMQTTFRARSGRTAYLFREDFCGTASACCEWVRQGREYQAIGVDIDPSVLEFALTELHARHRVPLLPCHPRDLIGMALDQARYEGGTTRITSNMLATAWKNYFVNLDVDPDTDTTSAGQDDSDREEL